MKKIVLILVMVMILGACTKVPESVEPPVIIDDPAAPAIPDEVMTSGNFEEDLTSLMPSDQNVVISPFSIKMALALAANGAAGDTQKEILEVLGVTDLGAYNEAAQKAIQDGAAGEIELNISNSIWLNTDTQPGVTFSDEYKRVVDECFEATAAEVKKDNAVKTINDWVEEKTKGKIKDILSDDEFLAALVNAIYFKADWVNPFEAESTYEMEFTDANGKKTEIDFMNQSEDFNYYEDENLQMLEMAYKGDDISMYVFLPKEGKSVTQAGVDKAIAEKKMEEVEVSIPKFKTEFDVKLKDILKTLGVSEAFNPLGAEFKGMFDNLPEGDNVWIDDVIHKAFIEVDEKGTEAAAATVVVMYDTAMLIEDQPKPKVFKADRPFSYIIRDNVSGDIYFSGQFSYAE